VFQQGCVHACVRRPRGLKSGPTEMICWPSTTPFASRPRVCHSTYVFPRGTTDLRANRSAVSYYEADATGGLTLDSRSFTQRRVVARSARTAARVATAVPVGRTARAAPRRRSRAARRRATPAGVEPTANVATDAARRASKRLAGRPRRAIHIVRGEKLNLDVSITLIVTRSSRCIHRQQHPQRDRPGQPRCALGHPHP